MFYNFRTYLFWIKSITLCCNIFITIATGLCVLVFIQCLIYIWNFKRKSTTWTFPWYSIMTNGWFLHAVLAVTSLKQIYKLRYWLKQYGPNQVHLLHVIGCARLKWLSAMLFFYNLKVVQHFLQTINTSMS